TIEKKLPVQGGLGSASSNGVATMLALERELRLSISPEDKLRIAAEVGSDLPLFALGGAVLGIGRGEQGFPLPDLPGLHCGVALPQIAVSTPQAFAQWDRFLDGRKLTEAADSDRISLFSRSLHEWLGAYLSQLPGGAGGPAKSGVPRGRKH